MTCRHIDDMYEEDEVSWFEYSAWIVKGKYQRVKRNQDIIMLRTGKLMLIGIAITFFVCLPVSLIASLIMIPLGYVVYKIQKHFWLINAINKDFVEAMVKAYDEMIMYGTDNNHSQELYKTKSMFEINKIESKDKGWYDSNGFFVPYLIKKVSIQLIEKINNATDYQK